MPPTVRLTAERFGAEKANLTFGWIFAGHQLGAATAAFGAGFSRSDFATYLPALYVAGVRLRDRGRSGADDRPATERGPRDGLSKGEIGGRGR